MNTESERLTALADYQFRGGGFCLQNDSYWRCERCGKLLGRWDGEALVVRHGRVHLQAGLPVKRRCERCGRWNELAPEKQVENKDAVATRTVG